MEQINYEGAQIEERTSVLDFGRWQHTIRFRPDDMEEDMVVTLPMGRWDYGGIVSGIVKARYSDDDATAIMLNMQGVMANCMEVDDAKAAEYQEEYMALERWRQYAKGKARYFVEKYGYEPSASDGLPSAAQ